MRFINDGVIQLHHVPSVANPAAPTLAEITAGDELTGFMLDLDTPLEGSTVDSSDASSKYNKTTSGTYGGQELKATFYRDKTAASDTAFNLLPRATSGFWVVARRGGGGANNALQAGDKVDVFKVEVITRNPLPYARNEMAKFAVSCSVPDEPEEDVAIV